MRARNGIQTRVGPGVEWLALSASGLTALLSVAYILLIDIDIDSDYARVAFIAVAMAAAAACLLATVAVGPPEIRLALAAFAATTLLLLAWLAMMSIGLLIAVPAVLAIAMCRRTASALPTASAVTVSIVSGTASVVLLVLGFVAT